MSQKDHWRDQFCKSVVMKKKIQCYLFVFFYTPLCIAITIGSDTSVNRFNTQQTLNTGDRVAGFAWLVGGFMLNDSTVTATFDSFFGVSGNVNFRGGTLRLNRDLVLDNITTISTLGGIDGRNFMLDLSENLEFLPTATATAGCPTFANLKVGLNSDITLKNCCLRFRGDSVLLGRGHCLTLDSTSTLMLDVNTTLLIQDIVLKDLAGTNLQATDTSSAFVFSNVVMDLRDDYRFTNGSFSISKDVIIMGDGHAFVYQTSRTSTVNPYAQLILEPGVTFSYRPTNSSRTLLRLVDNTSRIILNSASLHATTTGLQLTNGQLCVDGKSSLRSDSITMGQSIGLGNGTSANNLTVHVHPAASLEIFGQVTYDNA